MPLLKDLFFPRRCLGCRKIDTFLCDKCRNGLVKVSEKKCLFCQKIEGSSVCVRCRKNNGIGGAFAGAYYAEGPAKDLVWALKFKGVKEASVIMADIMADAISDTELAGFDVVPVPLGKYRFKERGFNQSTLIARALSRRFNLRFSECLSRQDRVPQMKLTRLQRKSNLKGVFCVKVKAPEKVIIVDDVLTTGSTLSECAHALRQAGTKVVYAIVFARD